jgi:hypothetical protein
MIDLSQPPNESLLSRLRHRKPKLSGSIGEHMPISALLKQLFVDAAALFRNEVALAKAEARESTRHALTAAKWAGATFVVLWTSLLTLVAAGVIALAAIVPLWLSAVIISAALALGGLLLLSISLGKINHSSFDMNRTRESLHKDSTLMAAGLSE